MRILELHILAFGKIGRMFDIREWGGEILLLYHHRNVHYVRRRWMSNAQNLPVHGKYPVIDVIS